MLKTKIVYALRIHLMLRKQGFKELVEMKNPHQEGLNCWVYEVTPEFKRAFEKIMREGASKNGRE